MDDGFHLVRPDERDLTQWDRLAVETAAPPFLRPGWIQAWSLAFGRQRDLHAALVRRGGELVAVLPVLRSNGSIVGVSNAHTPGVAHVARDAVAVRELFCKILERNFRKVDLNLVPARGPTSEGLIQASEGLGRDYVLHSVGRQPYVDSTGSWTEYERHQLTAKRRSTLRRLERRLAELGTVTFDVHDGRESLDALLDEGFRTEAQGWKGQTGTAVLSRPSTRQFYFTLASWAAQAGILRLACLRVDDRLAAFSFSLEQDAVHYGLKTSYDESLARFAPGILLTHRLIRYAFDHPGLSRLEMLGAADHYKAEFATGCREQERIQVFGQGVLGDTSRVVSSAQHSARRTVKKYLPQTVATRLCRATRRLRPEDWRRVAPRGGGR